MSDNNNFNSQRRNLMIINSIIFIMVISNTNITEFKILNIPFEIKKDNLILENYNILFIFTWIYFNIRYIATLIEKVNGNIDMFKNNIKVNQLTNNEITSAKELLNNKDIIIKFFAIYFIILFSIFKILVKILIPLFNKAIIDYIVPIIYSVIIVFIYLPIEWSLPINMIMLIAIGMLIDSGKLNLKRERYYKRRNKNNFS